tara:strand:- start:434 stop:583 length:150 start_codon:yes stop_codon:yes gene_type:complete
MEEIMAKGLVLLITISFLSGCGAHINLTASVPEGKDLDVVIKTSETPGK